MEKRLLKRTLIAVLAFFIMIPICYVGKAQAATKATLSETKKIIGIGTYGEVGGYFHKTKNKYCVTVKNAQKGAVYLFSSDNKKVVTVKKKGTKGYLTGVKAGTATITVKQSLRGKSTTVGKCKVSVKNATVIASSIADDDLGMGDDVLIGGAERDSICYVKYQNPAATYTYKCTDKNFKMTHVKADGEWAMGKGYFNYAQKYTAKKPGTYTVTLQEKYNGKTRTVGKFKVMIHDTIIQDNIAIYTGEKYYMPSLVQYYMGNYITEWDDACDSMLTAVQEDGAIYLKGLSAGEVEVRFYYADKNNQKKDYIGSCKVKITDVKVTDIKTNDSFDTYVGDFGSLDDVFWLITDPEDATYYGNVEYTSSNDRVIKISGDNYEVVGEGRVILTAKVGTLTKTMEVSVGSDELYDDEEE